MAKMPRRNVKRILRKVRKDVSKGGRTVSRKEAPAFLAQNVGRAPKRAFGTAKSEAMSVKKAISCLDARVPRTIGLPRAVGPYAVIRTTRLVSSDSDVTMFCPFTTAEPNWYNWCGVRSVDGAASVSATNNTTPILMPLDYLGHTAEVVPAALTVQVMNPAAIQSATGIFAMGRVNQQLNIGGASITWNELKARFISFYSPRLLSAGKLALRGVKCDSYPLDMTDYSAFNPLQISTGSNITWSASGAYKCAALAPIVFVQDNATRVSMEFMVTIEWRIRFDPGNPATASHVHHDTTSDVTWNGVVKTMSNVGHGVEELADAVTSIAGAARAVGNLL